MFGRKRNLLLCGGKIILLLLGSIKLIEIHADKGSLSNSCNLYSLVIVSRAYIDNFCFMVSWRRKEIKANCLEYQRCNAGYCGVFSRPWHDILTKEQPSNQTDSFAVVEINTWNTMEHSHIYCLFDVIRSTTEKSHSYKNPARLRLSYQEYIMSW